MTAFSLKRPSVLPGFGLTLGYSLIYLGVIVLLPLAGLVLRPAELGWAGFRQAVLEPRVLAALRLSFGAALIAAIVNAFFGLLIAWMLVRYRFPDGASSTRWSTCPLPCRPPSPASR